ncbi:MAG: STAS domain-containing protein [Bacillota bacterium]|nr:STAS domain-containing protein [Bacillota bacterium]
MLKVVKEQQELNIMFILSGELDMSTGDYLDKLVNDQDFSNISKISFCLTRLEFIDSTGIGQLITYYRQYSNEGINVEIINDNPEIEEVLELIGLREIMEIY